MNDDLISRQAAIDKINERQRELIYCFGFENDAVKIMDIAKSIIIAIPSAQPEPLTDKEQRIFLAAIEREMKVCEEVDRNYVREPYEDSLASVCREITRKVKGALWTI